MVHSALATTGRYLHTRPAEEQAARFTRALPRRPHEAKAVTGVELGMRRPQTPLGESPWGFDPPRPYLMRTRSRGGFRLFGRGWARPLETAGNRSADESSRPHSHPHGSSNLVLAALALLGGPVGAQRRADPCATAVRAHHAACSGSWRTIATVSLFAEADAI